MIELKYLSKTFQMKDGAVKALQNINLTIPDGSIYGIIGMSAWLWRPCLPPRCASAVGRSP